MDDRRLTQSTLILIRAILDKYEEMAMGEPLSIKNEVMTTEEAMAYLKISKPTLFQFIKSGRIRAKKLGKGYRMLRCDLDSLFQR